MQPASPRLGAQRVVGGGDGGLVGAQVARHLRGGGQEVVEQAVGHEDGAVVVEHHALGEHLPEPLGDRTERLPVHGGVVEDGAVVVDGDQAQHVHRAQLRVDLDDRAVAAVRERRRRGEAVLGAQRLRPGGQLPDGRPVAPDRSTPLSQTTSATSTPQPAAARSHAVATRASAASASAAPPICAERLANDPCPSGTSPVSPSTRRTVSGATPSRSATRAANTVWAAVPSTRSRRGR